MKLLHLACAALLLATQANAQTVTRKLNYDGVQRSYSLHLPRGRVGPAPLIAVLHGNGGTGLGIEKTSGFSRVADAGGNFIVAYPNAIRGNWSTEIDPGFVTAVFGDIARQYDVDPKRRYIVGFSQGGIIAEILGCAASPWLAAIADFSHVLGPAEQKLCAINGKMPVLIIHGGADPISPDAAATAAFWAERNGSSANPAVTAIPVRLDSGITMSGIRSAWDAAPVVYLLLTGAGHPFPSSKPGRYSKTTGRTATAIDNITTDPGAQTAWRFFSGFTR